MAGHWALHGVGMFAVEERQIGERINSSAGSGRGFRQVGPASRLAGASRTEFRGKGYALEAARASIRLVMFATFEIDKIIHCIDCDNTASQAVAKRLGARKDGEFDLFGHVADVWVTQRAAWKA